MLEETHEDIRPEGVSAWIRRTGNGGHRTNEAALSRSHRIDADGEGSVFLSLGYDQHNIVLSPGDEKALRHVGFQLNPSIAVAEFAKQVRAFGLAAEIKTDSQPAITMIPTR